MKFVGEHRDLGVLVSSSLKFHSHVDNVVRKASGLANNLLRSTVCREQSFMVSLFVSHIRPIMDYCSVLWNLGYLGDVRKMESVQRRWTRQIEGMVGLDYGTRLERLGLFSVAGRHLRADLIKVWKLFHREDRELFDGLFDRRTHASTRGHEFKLAVPRSRTDVKHRFFSSRVVSVWNGLPEIAVLAGSVDGFKKCLVEFRRELFYGVL